MHAKALEGRRGRLAAGREKASPPPPHRAGRQGEARNRLTPSPLLSSSPPLPAVVYYYYYTDYGFVAAGGGEKNQIMGEVWGSSLVSPHPSLFYVNASLPIGQPHIYYYKLNIDIDMCVGTPH